MAAVFAGYSVNRPWRIKKKNKTKQNKNKKTQIKNYQVAWM